MLWEGVVGSRFRSAKSLSCRHKRGPSVLTHVCGCRSMASREMKEGATCLLAQNDGSLRFLTHRYLP